MSTRPSRRWPTAPVSALAVLTTMLVPAAIGAVILSRSRAGRRIVPNARPTNPPSTPTANDTSVSSTACHTRTSEGRPSSSRVMFTAPFWK